MSRDEAISNRGALDEAHARTPSSRKRLTDDARVAILVECNSPTVFVSPGESSMPREFVERYTKSANCSSEGRRVRMHLAIL